MQHSQKRIILKLSGEALIGDQSYGINYQACHNIGKLIEKLAGHEIQIGVVIGGGNIFRGRTAADFGFERTPADHIGMLATCINGLALHQVLITLGLKTRVMSSRNVDGIIEHFNWHQAHLALEKGVVMIFVGGTGNPYFTTDTAAALRAAEMKADMLVKATTVDGVYDKDPRLNSDAKRYDRITYEEVLRLDLRVMDSAAIALCRDNHIEIRVVPVYDEEAILNAIVHRRGGTRVTSGEDSHGIP